MPTTLLTNYHHSKILTLHRILSLKLSTIYHFPNSVQYTTFNTQSSLFRITFRLQLFLHHTINLLQHPPSIHHTNKNTIALAYKVIDYSHYNIGFIQ